MIDDKEEYIKYLENKIYELSKNKEKEDFKFQNLIKYQEEFLLNKYGEKDWLIIQNKILHEENIRLLKTISFNQTYINYLLNSHWWKVTYPFRVISRNLNKKTDSYIDIINPDRDIKPLDIVVTVIIFSNNAGEEFSIQLDNLKKQKFIKNVKIIVVDRKSIDNTQNIAQKHGANIIQLEDDGIDNLKTYMKILPILNCDYVVVIDQNKIINSKYWLYQSVKPIYEKKAELTVFFREDMNNVIKSIKCEDLHKRFVKIAGEQVLFFPNNRNVINYISPYILDKASIIIKKRVSDMEIEGIL